MTKSYKMIILLYMLERGPDHWAESVASSEVAPFFHGYLMEKEYRRRIDFQIRTRNGFLYRLHHHFERKEHKQGPLQ